MPSNKGKWFSASMTHCCGQCKPYCKTLISRPAQGRDKQFENQAAKRDDLGSAVRNPEFTIRSSTQAPHSSWAVSNRPSWPSADRWN